MGVVGLAVRGKMAIDLGQQVDVQTPVMMVIRHSHRDVADNAQDLRTHGLTPLGHRMALKFGEKLPPSRDVRIFYSPRLRCVQTACDIAEGYHAIGGSAELISDIRVLLGPYGIGEKICEQMMQLGGPAFGQVVRETSVKRHY